MEPIYFLNGLPIEEWFTYHPPATDARRKAHEEMNQAALLFAKTVMQYVNDQECQRMAVFAIQQARMFGNQGITVDELKKEAEQRVQKSFGEN